MTTFRKCMMCGTEIDGLCLRIRFYNVRRKREDRHICWKCAKKTSIAFIDVCVKCKETKS